MKREYIIDTFIICVLIIFDTKSLTEEIEVVVVDGKIALKEMVVHLHVVSWYDDLFGFLQNI